MGQALGAEAAAHCKFKNDLNTFLEEGHSGQFTTEQQAVANKRVADAGGPAIFCSQIMESLEGTLFHSMFKVADVESCTTCAAVRDWLKQDIGFLTLKPLEELDHTQRAVVTAVRAASNVEELACALDPADPVQLDGEVDEEFTHRQLEAHQFYGMQAVKSTLKTLVQ
jgi:hypothetical protein